ncbi:LLM class F420-dependent oxidoreductase [Pseudonocardia xishanensis]|uniref:LLM class F420-dependent oxidoreductase n=1 Tax=Pseudonocardia xishanensis TaxID=630995 RepID=A0ABP8RH50_9PSEU
MDVGRYGIWLMRGHQTPEIAAEIEELGFGAIWVGGSPPADLAVSESLLAATERIAVGTSIVNMWQVAAEDVAPSYHRIADRHPDRFLLGVGIGHPEADRVYASPYDTIRSYLDELDTLKVPVEGRALAALGPKVLRVAGERTAGALPYLTVPAHTREARGILGDGPLLAIEQKIVPSVDPAHARAVAEPTIQRYLGLVNYRRNLLRSGFTEEDLDTASDRLVDALALHGTTAEIAAGLRAHADAGADHVAVQVLSSSGTVDDEFRTALRALAAALL